MKNAVIVHGWGADSQSNWFPWLKKELEKEKFKVTVPNFPNTQTPVLTEWLEYFADKVEINGDTLLIGHSLGVPLILRFLEQLEETKKIKSAFLVAGFERSLGIAETDNFVDKPFNWEKIKQACRKFCVIHSDNDLYIPLYIAEDLAEELESELIVEHNGGHLNAPGGYLKYPKLLELTMQNY